MRHLRAVWRDAARIITALSVAALGCDAVPIGRGAAPDAATASSAAKPAPRSERARAAPEARPPARDPSSRAQPRERLRLLEPTTDGKDGRFEGTSTHGARCRVRLATQHDPSIHRRQLAAYRLAEALRFGAVPHTEAQRMPLGELAALLSDQPIVRAAVEARVSVGNDGAIAALLQHSCPGRRLHVGTGPIFARWSELAASNERLEASESKGLRGYVEMVLLDYLTGNVERSFVAYDERTGRLCLDDNAGAFPGTVTAAAHDLLLARLRPIRRYPHGMLRALEQLSSESIRNLLQPGTFADWLVGPRELTEFGERKATVVTLIHALISRHGREQVLCLES